MRCGVRPTLRVVAGCASTAVSVQASGSAHDIAGTWHGWLITPREVVAAALTIQTDGTFVLTAPRTRVVGTITSAGGGCASRLHPGGARRRGWHGTITIFERGDTRLVKITRDDRMVPGRFTAEHDGA